MTLPPSDMLCFALYSATHAMQSAYAPLLAELGLTYPQYLVLAALWSSPEPQSVGAIGRAVQLDSSTLTPLVKRLEAMGLVTRRRCARDERRVLVVLTDTGKAMESRAAHIPQCIADRTGLSEDDIVALREAVFSLRDTLRRA
jgi:DNA-binding MarR family transcriptional regulator